MSGHIADKRLKRPELEYLFELTGDADVAEELAEICISGRCNNMIPEYMKAAGYLKYVYDARKKELCEGTVNSSFARAAVMLARLRESGAGTEQSAPEAHRLYLEAEEAELLRESLYPGSGESGILRSAEEGLERTAGVEAAEKPEDLPGEIRTEALYHAVKAVLSDGSEMEIMCCSRKMPSKGRGVQSVEIRIRCCEIAETGIRKRILAVIPECGFCSLAEEVRFDFLCRGEDIKKLPEEGRRVRADRIEKTENGEIRILLNSDPAAIFKPI